MSDNHVIAVSASAAFLARYPPRVQSYLEAIVRTCATGERRLVSVIVFGSAATGGFSGTVSDVDLILVTARVRRTDIGCATTWRTLKSSTASARSLPGR